MGGRMNDFGNRNYELTTVDPSAIAMAEAAKARIQAAYIMALKKPRSEDQARVRILEACRRPEFADRVEFSKPVGGKAIKGPSIRFAETALRLWENIDSDVQVIYDDDNVRRIRVRVTDLETNASFTKELSIRKTVERKSTKGRDGAVIGERVNSYGDKVYIVQATDDELMNKENALVSKAIRNEGLRLIPSDVIDEAIRTAKETLRNRDAIDPAAAKKNVVDKFAGLGVRPKELEKFLKHPLDSISPAELENLRGVYRAINDGEASWADYVVTEEEPKEAPKPVTFQDAKPEPPPEKPKAAKKDKAEDTTDEVAKIMAEVNGFEPAIQKAARLKLGIHSSMTPATPSGCNRLLEACQAIEDEQKGGK